MKTSMLRWLGIAILLVLGIKAEAAEWETDFAKASTNASKDGLFMLLDFSGSDWCGWCVQLDKEVFSRSEFKTFAKTNMVCVLIDFPRQKKQSNAVKKQNAALARKYDVKGYPTVILLSAEGEIVGRTGYRKGGAKKYVAHLQELIAEYQKKQAKQKTK